RPPSCTLVPYTTLFRSQERDEVPDIVQLELQALLRQAGGATDEAVRLMREAAALEDRMPAEFGPPADVKPAHELFGELLLEAGQIGRAPSELQSPYDLV